MKLGTSQRVSVIFEITTLSDMFNVIRIINDKRQVLVLPNLYFQIYFVLGNSSLFNITNYWQNFLHKLEKKLSGNNGNLEGFFRLLPSTYCLTYLNSTALYVIFTILVSFSQDNALFA